MSIIGRRPLVSEHFDFFDEKVKNITSEFKPGLSGISSIVFRDEEEYFVGKDSNENKKFYRDKISPYKGELELWYCNNQSVIIDILLIITTIVTVFVPSLKLHNYFFRDLPKHPLFNPE